MVVPGFHQLLEPRMDLRKYDHLIREMTDAEATAEVAWQHKYEEAKDHMAMRFLAVANQPKQQQGKREAKRDQELSQAIQSFYGLLEVRPSHYDAKTILREMLAVVVFFSEKTGVRVPAAG